MPIALRIRLLLTVTTPTEASKSFASLDLTAFLLLSSAVHLENARRLLRAPDKRRFELRNPDATCNPYFCYAAILMAGLDGVKNKIDPHANGWGPYDFNLFHLPEEEKAKLQGLPTSLPEALDALEADHDYLTAGGVFPEELIKNFIKGKRAECSEMSKIPHPAEFDKYYNL